MMADSQAVGAIAHGHILLVVCAALYLAWWTIFFRPGAQVTGVLHAIGALCLVGAAVCGVAGAVLPVR